MDVFGLSSNNVKIYMMVQLCHLERIDSFIDVYAENDLSKTYSEENIQRF